MKKWTYLVAAGMMLGATTVFTGCIDNDEPEGITVLRGAKAELLKAKAAVEAAKVAQVQAEAALMQAQAKVAEAKATKIQAEAEKLKAEAEIAKAEAALLNAQTDKEKAELQAIIEANERAQKEWEEEAAVRAAQAEAAIKEAEYAALTAKAKYQEALVSLQAAQQEVLDPYITKLDDTTEAYFDALEELRKAQRAVNDQQAVIAENEASKELLTRELQRDVKVAEAAKQGAQEAKEVAEKKLEEAKNTPISDLSVEKEKIETQAKAIWKEMADLKLEANKALAEMVASGRFDEVDLLFDQWLESMEAPQTIAAVEFDFGDGAGYPFYAPRGKYVLPEKEYTSMTPRKYKKRIKELNELLVTFQSWTRDANDNAWNTENIAEMKGVLAELNEEIGTVKQKWEEAVAAFKTGKYNTVDISKISGYDKVVEEITAFNKAAKTANTAWANAVKWEKKQVADEKSKDATLDKNEEIQIAAYAKAMEAYQKAMEVINETVATKTEALEKAHNDAMEDTRTKQAAYDKAVNDGAEEAVITAAKNALEAAKQVQRDAYQAWQAYDINAEWTAINDAYEKAKTDADSTKAAADKKANDEYNAQWNPDTGEGTLELQKAHAAVQVAETAIAAAGEKLKTASNAYNSNIPELSVTPIELSDIDAYTNGNWEEDEEGYYTLVRKEDLAVNNLIFISKSDLFQVVILRSDALFGTSIWGNEYGEPDARLVYLEDTEIKATIQKELDAMLEEGLLVNTSVYMRKCQKYGLTGTRLAYEEQIRIAESWLTNSEIIDGKIKQTEQAISDLTAQYEANEEAIFMNFANAYIAFITIQEEMAALEEPYLLKEAELEPLSIVYEAILDAIDEYEIAGEKVWTEKQIKKYIERMELLVETCESALYDAETALMEAEDRLANWNSGALDQLGVLQDKLEDAQAVVDRKKAAMESAQKLLDAMLANLSAGIE